MRDTVVVDLDGTLANIAHRRHFVTQDKPKWDDFYSACDKDIPNEWCVKLMAAMKAAGYTVLIVSARRDTEKEKTYAWLEQHGVAYDGLLLLRKGTDSTQDLKLKRTWLNDYGREYILFVVDDRQSVVDMWRQEGLVVLQCDAWEEYKPKK